MTFSFCASDEVEVLFGDDTEEKLGLSYPSILKNFPFLQLLAPLIRFFKARKKRAACEFHTAFQLLSLQMKNRFTFHLLIAFLLLIMGVTNALAQTKFTISGYVRDASSGETLIGAYVYEAANRAVGTSTNEYGFYSLTLPAGEHRLQVTFIGYTTLTQTVTLTQSQSLNFSLQPDDIILENEVEIIGERRDQNVESTRMGVVELPMEQVKSLPALMGEVDVIRTLQLLPGVMSSGEGNVGFYVRGGGPDQNLILLDEAVVYNTGHLFGFFSVFNSDALKNTTLHKGNMPAEYGGRLSSVLDVQMKEGNNQSFHGEGGIGLISSRLTLEGPIQKNKSSFLISGRRTYADVLIKPFLKGTEFEGNGYYFYDLNTKINYQFSDKDRVFASGYFGRDVFDYKSVDEFSLNMPWGNATATLRWNHVFSNKLFVNTSAIYNAFNFEANSKFNSFSSRFYSGVRDWNGKIDFDYFPSINHTLKFGTNYTYHTFTPYSYNASVGETNFSNEDMNKQNAHELAFYVQDEFGLGEKLKINVGLRASGYQQMGPYQTVNIDSNGLLTDTVVYAAGKPIVTYTGLEPRLGVRLALGQNSSLKGSITFTNQYIHLVSNSGSTLPTDLWVPSTLRTKPQRGIQYSLGYFQNFLDNEFETSVEVYYKDLQSQIEFSDNYVPSLNEPIEFNFVYGKGRTYGLELFLKKRHGKFNGWIGYTLARAERQFGELNAGDWFPTKYDRTHDVSVVLMYEPSKRWDLSLVWVYGTGQTFTPPVNLYFIDGNPYVEYDDNRNSYRLAPYHRLDVSATFRLNKRENAKLKTDLVVSAYNAYSRWNPFFVYPNFELQTVEDPETGEVSSTGGYKITLKQVSIFPIVPSITWNFKW